MLRWKKMSNICAKYFLYNIILYNCIACWNICSFLPGGQYLQQAFLCRAYRWKKTCLPHSLHAHPHHMVVAQQQHWLRRNCFKAPEEVVQSNKAELPGPSFHFSRRAEIRTGVFICRVRAGGPCVGCELYAGVGVWTVLACWLTVWSLTKMNGHLNGFYNDSLIDEDCFLFTSESVGEGHPGLF